MIFFGKRGDVSPDKPKRRITIGRLFNPNIGADLRAFKQTNNVFVNLLAMIFAMNGLFPKDHPALQGDPTENGGLTLLGVFQTAWNDLSFTKEGIPKTILFFAVTGTLFLSILMVLTIFILLFVGHAHAATGSYFTPVDTTNDLAQGWLNFLFKNQPLPNYVDQNGAIIGQYSDIQQALVTSLAFYSNAILILAAIILFYHLVSMVVETAHHGQAFGKRASPIWAPIRLVVAVGLLVPVSSTGLNTGQYIVIQMAEWGSGLGSQLWNIFVTAKKYAYVAPPIPDIHELAESIVKINACEYIMNGVLNQTTASSGISMPDNQITQQNMANLNPGETGYAYQSNIILDKNICGSYIFKTLTPPNKGIGTTIVPAIGNAQKNAFLAAFNQATSDLQPLFTATPPDFITDGIQPPTYTNIVADVAKTYETTLSNALTSALSNIVSDSSQEVTPYTQQGWIAAGAWFNDVASNQGLIENLVSQLPTVSDPDLAKTTEENQRWTGESSGHYQAALRAYESFEKWVHHPDNSVYLPTTTPTTCDGKTSDGGTWNALKNFTDNIVGLLEQKKNIVDIVAQYVDYVAAGNCIWHATTDPLTGDQKLLIGIQLTDRNPFAELARLGHANLNVAYELLNTILWREVEGGAVSGFGSALQSSTKGWAKVVGVVGQGVGGAITFTATILSFIGLLFFAAGFTLAFFLPLIPFIKFFFNALSWVGSVLEAVVMIPLVALAHINPEGEGLPGNSAKTAYFYIFNIFLRPAMMVFGLICGMLVFVTAVAFMNVMYQTAIVGALGGVQDIGGSPHLVVSRLIFSIFYVALIYLAATNAFQLIHFFGDSAMDWIGAKGHRRAEMGDAQHLGTYVSGVSAIAGEQIFSKIQSAKILGQAVGGAAGRGTIGAGTGIGRLTGRGTPPAPGAPTGPGTGPAGPGGAAPPPGGTTP